MKGMITLLCLVLGVQYSLGSEPLHREIDELLNKHNIPGAVAIWVQGDEVLFSGTYGYADLEERRPVDPDKSLIRIGSVSKPFTSLGALHLVEKGELDLQTDLNEFFDEPVIQDRFSSAVTMEHLLTHTAGFEDRFIGKSARTREEALSLEEAVRNMVPDRFIESGEIASYSNYGVALAGYVVETVSGRPFAEFMEAGIFRPLGMSDSSFDPDEAAIGKVMTGYYTERGALAPVLYDYIMEAPAGQMVATGNDMARFMIHMLNPERIEDAGVLSSEKVQEMTSIRFTHHPELSGGFGYLWSIYEQDGRDFYGHSGGYAGAATHLVFSPEHHAAWFVAANIMDFEFLGSLSDLLSGHFLPDTEGVHEPGTREMLPEYRDDRSLSDFAGSWRETRYPRSDFSRFAVLFGIMGHELKTGIQGDSLLTMPTHTGELRTLRRVGPALFQSVDDDYMLAFRISEGRITHVFTDGRTALERLHPLETANFHLTAIGLLQLLFTGIFLIYPVMYIIRKRRGLNPPLSSAFRYEWGIAAAYALGFWLYLPVMMQIPAYEMQIGFAYGVPKALYVLSLLPYAALIGTIIFAIKLLRNRHTPAKRRMWSVTVMGASVIYFLILDYWNQAGWQF